MAAGCRDERRLNDTLGVSGLEGAGDWKAVRLSPTTLGVWLPFAGSVRGVGGNRGGVLYLVNRTDMNCGGSGGANRMRLRFGVGVCISMSATCAWLQAGGLQAPSAGPGARAGVCCGLGGGGDGGRPGWSSGSPRYRISIGGGSVGGGEGAETPGRREGNVVER